MQHIDAHNSRRTIVFLSKYFLKQAAKFGSNAVFILAIILTLSFSEFVQATFLVSVFVVSYCIAIFCRLVFFRERPHKVSHGTIVERIKSSSFPSLHALRICALTTFVSIYSYPIFLLVSMGILSGLVIASRYLLGKHHKTDLAFGALLGILIPTLIYFVFF